ncbi:MAG: AI-2E family transporter [Gemmatimonadales bacterium]
MTHLTTGASAPAGPNWSPPTRLLLAAACLVVILAGVRAVAPVLNNVLMALLLALVMAPIARLLVQRGLRPVAAVSLTVLSVLVFLVTVSVTLGRSLAGLTRDLPTYAAALDALRARGLQQLVAWGVNLQGLEVTDFLSPSRAIGFATGVLSWLAGAFGDSFLVFFLATIMLAHFAQMHRRKDEGTLVSDSFIARLDAVTVDVRPYLQITATTGLAFAVVITIVLTLLGVPYAVVWGVLSFFLNFVPQVGIIVSWVPPAVLAMVTHGWSRAVIVVVAYTVINFIIDNVIKPRFMAAGLNISFLAIMLSLLFWGWVLGPAGAILSVPLTLAVRRFAQQFDANGASMPAPLT